MADFRADIPILVAAFIDSTQDKTISEFVAIIKASRECVGAKVNSAGSNYSA
jgi:hypothetical protein